MYARLCRLGGPTVSTYHAMHHCVDLPFDGFIPLPLLLLRRRRSVSFPPDDGGGMAFGAYR